VEEVPAGHHRGCDKCDRLHNQLLLEVEAAEEASQDHEDAFEPSLHQPDIVFIAHLVHPNQNKKAI